MKQIKINSWFADNDRLREYFKANDCNLVTSSIYPQYSKVHRIGYDKTVGGELNYYQYGLEFRITNLMNQSNTEAQVILFCRNNNFDFSPTNPISKNPNHFENIMAFKLYEK